jgi:predicted nucleotidyltransferase
MIADLESHRDKLRGLCRRFHIRRLDLFGSAARDDFAPERSDLDFPVEFEVGEPSVSSLDIFLAFRDSLEALFGRKVDLVESGAIRNPYLKAEVERSREPLFEA